MKNHNEPYPVETLLAALRGAFPAATVTASDNTSGCPLIRIDQGDHAFHLTLTRARR